MRYRGYVIEFNVYGKDEYTIQFEGDDFFFQTLDEAKQFIDKQEQE